MAWEGYRARTLAVRGAWIVATVAFVAFAGPRVTERLKRSGAADLRVAAPGAAGGPIDRAKAAAALAGRDPLEPGGQAAQAPSGDVPPRAPEQPSTLQVAAAAKAESDLQKTRANWEKVTILSPREGKGSAVGERHPFDGFALSVETDPEGSAVSVNGKPLGPSPVMTAYSCAVGQPLVVRAEHPKLGAREAKLECGANELVRISLKLGGPAK
jgi:hypothetical protein